MEDFLARWAIPAAIVVGSLVIGVIVDRVIMVRIRASAERREWRGGEAVARALPGIAEVLFVLGGTAIAAHRLDLAPSTLDTTRTLLIVAAIIASTVFAVRLATHLTHLYTSREDAIVPSSTIFVNITRVAVVVIGLLVALNALGISITPMLAALGVGGLAVALALQDTLSNLFAGLQLIASKQIQPGDYIQLETGQEGYVEDMTWRFTTIRPFSNNMIIIPNANLASSLMINFQQPVGEMSVYVEIGVSYKSDLAHVESVTHRVAREVMERVDGAVPDFTPVILFHTFGDSSIRLTVVLRVAEYADKYMLTHEFVKAIHSAYAEEGIEIPFPQRVVHKPAGE